MIEIQLEKTSFKIHDEISQLPADRYKDFQKYQLMDGGIGASMSSVDERFATLFQLISRGKKDDAMKEAENLYYAHYFIIKKISPQHLSFASLIHSIEGEKIDDYSEANLNKIITQLSDEGLTQDILIEKMSESKKKFDRD